VQVYFVDQNDSLDIFGPGIQDSAVTSQAPMPAKVGEPGDRRSEPIRQIDRLNTIPAKNLETGQSRSVRNCQVRLKYSAYHPGEQREDLRGRIMPGKKDIA
jgi:hypothetical protein